MLKREMKSVARTTGFKEIDLKSRKEAFLTARIQNTDIDSEGQEFFIGDLVPEDYEIIRGIVFSCSSGEEEGGLLELLPGDPAFPLLLSEEKNYELFLHLIKTKRKTEKKNIEGIEVFLLAADEGEYTFVNGLHSYRKRGERVKNEIEVLDLMKKVLQFTQNDFSGIVRTWFYLDEILEWYSLFNKNRTDFYADQGLFPSNYPASTGIGISNSSKLPLIAFFNIVRNLKGSLEPVSTEKQCKATDYGSSFSRGMIMKTDSFQRLYLSGTASIDENGNTVFKEDPDGQIHQTYRVVHDLLKDNGMEWSDVCWGIIYVKDRKIMDRLNFLVEEANLPEFPSIICFSDICRDDLLFEIEVEAFKKKII